MHIAICDDETKDLEEITALVQDYPGQNVRLSGYRSAKDLLQAAPQSAFDVVLLDIEMPVLNGYEAALELKKLPNPPIILFLTNSMEYTLRGYGLVFRYLKKPIEGKTLYEALDAAFCEISANRFIFSSDGNTHVIPMRDIYYLEILNHHVLLHTQDREFTFRTTLKEVMCQLPAGYFGMPHQSYVLNFSHIASARGAEIYLTNGACIPISRRKQKEFMEQFHGYLGR